MKPHSIFIPDINLRSLSTLSGSPPIPLEPPVASKHRAFLGNNELSLYAANVHGLSLTPRADIDQGTEQTRNLRDVGFAGFEQSRRANGGGSTQMVSRTQNKGVHAPYDLQLLMSPPGFHAINAPTRITLSETLLDPEAREATSSLALMRTRSHRYASRNTPPLHSEEEGEEDDDDDRTETDPPFSSEDDVDVGETGDEEDSEDVADGDNGDSAASDDGEEPTAHLGKDDFVLDPNKQGRKADDVMFLAGDGSLPKGKYVLLNRYGYPSIQSTKGRYVDWARADGTTEQLDQAVHFTIRIEHKTTHFIEEKAFDAPSNWDDDEQVRRAFKPVLQHVRRRVGSLTVKDHYTAAEEDYMRRYVAGHATVDWTLPKGREEAAWGDFWVAYRARFPRGRRESGVWTKMGPGKSRMNLIRQKPGKMPASIEEGDEDAEEVGQEQGWGGVGDGEADDEAEDDEMDG